MTHFLTHLDAFLIHHPRVVTTAILLYFLFLALCILFLPVFAYSH